MLFPLFLIGEWQTSYEYTIEGTQNRVDYLISGTYLNQRYCTIIELKRSGNINEALAQAIAYGN